MLLTTNSCTAAKRVSVKCPSCGWTGHRVPEWRRNYAGHYAATCPQCAHYPITYRKQGTGALPVVRPTPTLVRFNAVGISGRVVLQRSLRIRECDRVAILIMAWASDAKVPYYLTPDGMLWNNGLDGKRWLHHCFAVFPSQMVALEVIRDMRWGEQWQLLQLAQVALTDDEIRLLPVQLNNGESPPLLFSPKERWN